MNGITRNQWLQIVAVIFGALIGASALWTQLFGANTGQIIVSLIGVASTILAGVTYVLTGQAQQVKDVLAMPGIQNVTVNSAASQVLAQIAVDPTANKIAPSQAALDTVTQTAKGD